MADEDVAREDSTSGISAFGLIIGLEIWLIVFECRFMVEDSILICSFCLRWVILFTSSDMFL